MGGRGQFMTLTMKPSMAKIHCLDGPMVLPDVELLYISPWLRIGGRRSMGQRPNTCFKASARSAGRIWHMCVQIVLTQMRSEMKCGSATLRKTVPVLHSICTAQMTFSDKYIIIKSFYFYFLCHQCSTIIDTSLMLFCVAYSMFSTCKMTKKTPQLKATATSIEVKFQ